MNVTDLIAKLQQRDAELGDGRDVLLTANAQEQFHAEKRGLSRTISALLNLPADLNRASSMLADAEARRAAVVAKSVELTAALADAPDPATMVGARARNEAHDRRQHLRRQLQLLHAGELLCAPGVAYERLVDLDDRIEGLKSRRDDAQRALDSFIKQAETLLAATVVG